MSNETVQESPAPYAANYFDALRQTGFGTSVLLHGVSWSTFERLIDETGEDRKARFAYDCGEFEIRASTENHVLLHGVSWETYVTLMNETGNQRRARFIYDNGELEIMAPHFMHENSNYFIIRIIEALAKEFGFNFQPAGALTCKREDLKRGLEPDSSFYIQNADRIRAAKLKGALDLTIHPPPDLMIEVDIGNSSLDKLSICADLRVPEVWRFDGRAFEIRILKKGKYAVAVESAIFPGMPLCKDLPELVYLGIEKGPEPMLRAVRKWIRKNRKK